MVGLASRPLDAGGSIFTGLAAKPILRRFHRLPRHINAFRTCCKQARVSIRNVVADAANTLKAPSCSPRDLSAAGDRHESRCSPLGCRRVLDGRAWSVPRRRSMAVAEDFRIETKIFVGDAEEPASTATTLFQGGVVYDFLAEPEQIAVFRKPGGGKPGRFILLDPVRRVRTELSTDQLASAMNKLRNWAARQKDPFLKFAANPQFEESFDRETGQLLLASHEESYTIKTEPADMPEALAEYREFLDWYTRLNALLQAGPPPEPRLQVNAALARYQTVPVTVELARAGREGKAAGGARVHLAAVESRTSARIDDACASLAAYRPVDNEEFLQEMKSPADAGEEK